MVSYVLDGAMMIEGGVTLNMDGKPVMASSTLLFQEWLDELLNTNCGISIQFKIDGCVKPVLEIMKQKITQFKQPVKIGGDFIQEPGGTMQTLNSKSFKNDLEQNFPFTTVSLSWVTTLKQEGTYSKKEVEDMMTFAKTFQQPISLQIPASHVRSLWQPVMSLLDSTLCASVTIVSQNNIINVDDMKYIRENSENHRIFYNIPESQHQRILHMYD